MKRVLIAALAAAGALTGYFALRSSKPLPTAQVAVPNAPDTSRPEAKVANRAEACHFAPGGTSVYRYGVRTESKLDSARMAMPAGAVAPGKNRTQLLLNLETLRTDGQGALLLARFSELSVAEGMATEQLTQPFLLNVGTDCAIAGYARLKTTPVAQARLQQALMHELSWRWPNGEASMSGEDGVGRWRGKVVAAIHDGAPLVQRRIDQYDALWTERAVDLPVQDSLANIHPGQAEWFEAFDSRQLLTTRGLSTTTTTEAKRVPLRADLKDAPRDVNEYVFENLLPKQSAQREVQPLSRADRRALEAMRHVTLDQSVSDFEQRIKNKVGIAEQWPPLAVWLEAHPEQTDALVTRMKKGELTPQALMIGYIALGNARTPQARDALLAIKRDSHAPPMERTRAMFSLIDRADVTPAFAQELFQDSKSLMGSQSRGDRFVGGEALLALTAMAGLREEPPVVEVATEAVVNLLRANGHPSQTRKALAALGNIGKPELLYLAEPFTRAPDEKVRAEAAKAFRRLRPEHSTSFVTSWLKRENSARVKREVYYTLEAQMMDTHSVTPDDIIARVVADLEGDSLGLIARKSMVRLLGRAATKSPVALAALKKQAKLEFDRKSGLFDTVARFLPPEDVREVLAP